MTSCCSAVLKIIISTLLDPFKTFGRSIVKTTVMAIGEFDYTNTLIDGLGQANNRSGIRLPLIPFPAISNTFFYIFMLTMPIVVDRRIYTRIFQFPLRINVKISEYAQNFNVFKPRLVCRRILILPSGSSVNSQKSEILKNMKFSKI